MGAQIDALLIKELYAEFAFGDTNWGSSADRELHVVAPNPKTGEPKLWKKEEFSGQLMPVRDDFVNGNWKAIKVGPTG